MVTRKMHLNHREILETLFFQSLAVSISRNTQLWIHRPWLKDPAFPLPDVDWRETPATCSRDKRKTNPELLCLAVWKMRNDLIDISQGRCVSLVLSTMVRMSKSELYVTLQTNLKKSNNHSKMKSQGHTKRITICAEIKKYTTVLYVKRHLYTSIL